MLKKILLVLLSLLLISLVIFIWQIRSENNSNIKYINGLLFYLDIEMDLIEYSQKHYSNDKFLETRLAHLITNKLFIISRANPPISELKGTPLKALHRLIIFNKANPIKFSEYGSAFLTIEDYLKSVEGEVRIEIKNRDTILSDPLKKEVKERWNLLNSQEENNKKEK